MPQTLKHPRYAPHLWTILIAVLALAILYPIENSVGWQPGEAVSTLGPTFSLPGGYHDQDVLLKISAPCIGNTRHSEQCNVIFTVDGSVPTHSTGTIPGTGVEC